MSNKELRVWRTRLVKDKADGAQVRNNALDPPAIPFLQGALS